MTEFKLHCEPLPYFDRLDVLGMHVDQLRLFHRIRKILEENIVIGLFLIGSQGLGEIDGKNKLSALPRSKEK